MKNKFKSVPVKSSEITSYSQYLSRRDFLKAAGIVTGSAFLAACNVPVGGAPSVTESAVPESEAPVVSAGLTDELGAPVNTYSDITQFNNFYEFTTEKADVWKMVDTFNPSPWTVEVTGLVNNPKTFGIEDLLGKFTQEERIYRLRCVEGWSMVIPWTGFTLASLLKEVEPTSNAKFVRFVSVLRPEELPGQSDRRFPWPYYEGLRLDEAMNDLTLLATGLYGQSIPNQSGAPIRLVVPWKYGYKSIKSIVKIELIAEQPTSLWSDIGPYGFYSNVDPNDPRQSAERRVGELGRHETLMFNGYGEQVADLYADIGPENYY